MKTSAVILVALLATGCLCSGISYPTVGDAFDAAFLSLGRREFNPRMVKSSLGSTPVRVVTFSSTQENLQENLISKKVSEQLASFIVSAVDKNLKDTYIRTTGIITSEENENTLEKAVCVYRTGKDEANDFICIVGELSKSSIIKTFSKKMAETLEGLMKNFVDNFPSKLKNLHAFTTKGFQMLRGLGSAESQAKLNEFLNESAKNKDTAYATLQKSQDDPFVVKLFKNGLTHFTSTASVESLEGVESCLFEDYYTHLIHKMAIAENTREDFRNEMRLAAFGSKGEWKSVDFVFKNSQSTAKYINVMCAYNDSLDEADFLIADIKAGFTLGPDVIVSTTTSKSLFGLISKTKLKIIYRPAELTEKSIQLIFDFFKLTALEKFAAFRRGGK